MSVKKKYQPRNYTGIIENTFKTRYANHERSFNINRYKNDTKISVCMHHKAIILMTGSTCCNKITQVIQIYI